MQPPPLPEIFRISYRMTRKAVIQIWFRHWMRRPRSIYGSAIMIVLGAICFVVGHSMEYAGIICLASVAFTPWSAHRAIARMVDGDAQFTDPKTLEFGQAGIVLIGPDYKSEMAWSHFKRFSEDANYFYLYLHKDFPSALPKTSFDPQAAEKFRDYASSLVQKP